MNPGRTRKGSEKKFLRILGVYDFILPQSRIDSPGVLNTRWARDRSWKNGENLSKKIRDLTGIHVLPER